MPTAFKTLPAAMSKLDNAERTMGRGNLYRIRNGINARTGKRGGFYIACYSQPLAMPAAVVASGLRVDIVDGEPRAFLGYF